jgi:hypothetical protein
MKTYNKSMVLAALAIFALAGGAVQALGLSQATLQTPVAQPKSVVIDGKVWKCAGVDCSASADGAPQPATRECARAAKVLGGFTRYSKDGRPLDDAALAACNKG